MIKSSDANLKVSHQKMDRAAFKQVYTQCYKTVFNHLYFACNNYELTRDLTQESFVKLWEQRDKIDDSKTIQPYLLKIAKNLLTDHYRHKKVEQKFADGEAHNEQTDNSLESQTQANMLEEKIRDVVTNQLAPKTAAIFVMSRFEGKSNDEISEIFGLTKKTIENQLHLATSVIRKKIKHFLLGVLMGLTVLIVLNCVSL